MLQIGASDLAGAIASTGFALGAVVVLSVWLLYLQRETGFQKVSIHRSRYLEEQLKMRRELLISAFDELAEQDPSRTAYAQLTDRERKDMDDVYEKVYRFRLPFVTPGGTTDTLYRIGFAVMVGWVFVVVWRWLIYAGVID